MKMDNFAHLARDNIFAQFSVELCQLMYLLVAELLVVVRCQKQLNTVLFLTFSFAFHKTYLIFDTKLFYPLKY